MPQTPEILFQADGDIGWIKFNRPGARNALTFDMYLRVAELCESPPAGIKTLIVSGVDETAFAAGTDIAQFRAFHTPQDGIDYEARIDAVLGAVETCRLPVIAAISGPCIGGGAAIASACDMRICTANMKFGFPIARTLGNCLSAASLARLAALMGAGRVRELIFTSRLMGAEEARQAGLVSEILPDHAALEGRGRELASLIAGQAPLTLRATKALQRRLAAHAVEDQDWIVKCYTSRDFKEGLEAFLGKRKPRWTGE